MEKLNKKSYEEPKVEIFETEDIICTSGEALMSVAPMKLLDIGSIE